MGEAGTYCSSLRRGGEAASQQCLLFLENTDSFCAGRFRQGPEAGGGQEDKSMEMGELLAESKEGRAGLAKQDQDILAGMGKTAS